MRTRVTQLRKVKAVITDYIGTLVNAHSYTMDVSLEKLHEVFVKAGFPAEKERFLVAYRNAHEKYRLIRYGKLREVTNAVWVSEALNSLGFDVGVEDPKMLEALDVFFKDYIDSLELRPCAEAPERCQKNLQTGVNLEFYLRSCRAYESSTAGDKQLL